MARMKPTAASLPRSGSASFKKIQQVLNVGVHVFPENGKYNGNGAPGRLLEDLLGIKENNADSPDLADWEVKFHGGTALLTLFHKDPEPTGIIGQMVHEYGWNDAKGRISFRHTIAGETGRGFYVVNEEDRILIRNRLKEGVVPYWTHNTLINAFSSKLRRLIVVEGRMLKNPRRVHYREATAYWEPDVKGLCKAITEGVFHVDFDARTHAGPGSAIRNHGTKFRIKIQDLGEVYSHTHKIVTSAK